MERSHDQYSATNYDVDMILFQHYKLRVILWLLVSIYANITIRVLKHDFLVSRKEP